MLILCLKFKSIEHCLHNNHRQYWFISIICVAKIGMLLKIHHINKLFAVTVEVKLFATALKY